MLISVSVLCVFTGVYQHKEATGSVFNTETLYDHALNHEIFVDVCVRACRPLHVQSCLVCVCAL